MNMSLLLPLTRGNGVVSNVILVRTPLAPVTNTHLLLQSVLALLPSPGTCKPSQALFQGLRVKRIFGPVRIARGFRATAVLLTCNDIFGPIRVMRGLHSGSAVVYPLNPLHCTTSRTPLLLTFVTGSNGLEDVGKSSVGETPSSAILATTTSLVSEISTRLLTAAMIK